MEGDPDNQVPAADLTDADLRNADLRDAQLSDVTGLQTGQLAGADLSNADLTSSDLTSANLTGALYDDFTVFPSGNTYDLPPWGLPNDTAPWHEGMIYAPEPSAGLLLIFGAAWLAGLARMKGG